MKFSIITISFQDIKALEKTIGSVSAQSYNEIEHIVIDGGSDGFNYKKMSEKKRFHGKIVSERDNGIYDAMNKGISLASGDYIGFLNSGDVFASEFIIEEMASALASEKDAQAIFSNILFKNGDMITRRWVAGNFKRWKFWWGWMPPHPSLYVDGAILKKNPFDDSFKIAADYDLILRLFYNQRKSAFYFNKVSVIMEDDGVSNDSLSNICAANREVLGSWGKNSYIIPFWIMLTKPLSKILHFDNFVIILRKLFK